MARGLGAVLPGPPDVGELLPLAFSRPSEALAGAREVLAGRPSSYDASVAHQAAGIVLREFGDAAAGLRETRAALRLAQQTGSVALEADVLATLGVALVYAGRTAEGLAAFDRAVKLSNGVVAGKVLHRRGIVLLTIGRHAAALNDARRAVGVLRRAGDQLWTARATNARGAAYLMMGLTARADADFRAAGDLFTETSQVFEAIQPVHNRALVAFASGDLPAALSYLDEAAARYRPLGVPMPDISIDRCLVLLAAGLADEALAEADAAIDDFVRINGRPTKKAELLLTAASCALAAARPQVALDRAKAAHGLFRSQHNEWWQAHAAAVLVQAKYSAGLTSGKLLSEASRAAKGLKALAPGDAVQAHLLAGRVALELGRHDEADRHLLAAAQSRRRGPALARASGWLSEALRAQAAGDPGRMLTACQRGLEVLDEHRLTLGASELRAHATAYGAELALLAQRHAVRAGRPRLLLSWSERWRATAQAVPAVRPLADAELTGSLAALRDVTRHLEQMRRLDAPSASAQREQVWLERERRRLENAVRARALRARGIAYPGQASISIPELFDQLGAAQLIEITDIDGSLHVLLCRAGKVRQFAAGRAVDAIQAVAFARFALRRLARNRPGDEPDSAMAILATAGPKLQETLLGPACRYLGDVPTIIVPPGRLHAVPWALLPALRERVVSVAPSATGWLRAHHTRPPRRRHVTLACGPGLATNGAEVPVAARLFDDVTVLTGSQATAEQVLRALDGASLAHVAAHGTFRADSPLFSALRMYDGPLTVYDLEQLRRAPYRLILSSCDSGIAAPAGADELLGLVSSLLQMGTAGIIASIAPLNDHAVVPVMLHLHRCLQSGLSLAESMHAVRSQLPDDPVQQATAASLVAFGAA